MSERRLAPLPRTALLQVKLFPNEAELDEVTQRLHGEIKNVLQGQQISIIESSARTKTLERRMDKLQRRGRDFPLPDVHGVRLILAAPDTHPAAQIILDHYPSPEKYWWGLPSYRDYSDPNMKGKYNRASLDSYEAIHLNIRINEGARMAEVQIMTPEQFIIAEQTREEYLRRQSIFD